MSKVDATKFPHTQALEMVKGSAKGTCFLGLCAVLGGGARSDVALIAADIESLESAWDKLNIKPLDRAGIQYVAIFSQDVLTREEHQ